MNTFSALAGWRRGALSLACLLLVLVLGPQVDGEGFGGGACLVQPVQAAGYYLPGRGVRALGRAGAFVVSGEGDLNSLWYNPANLAGLGEGLVNAELAFVHQSLGFARAPRVLANGEVRSYEPVASEAPAEAIPQLLVGAPTGIEGLVWAAGAYTPYMSAATFGQGGPQRYVLVDTKGSGMGMVQVALAWQPHARLRLGAGLQNYMARFRIVNVASAYTGVFGDAEDEDLDVLLEVDMRDWFSLTGNLGVWAALSDRWQVGLAAQLPVRAADDAAAVRARLPAHVAFDDARLLGDSVRGEMGFPAIVRAGLRHVGDWGDVELALSWENWSVFERIDARPNNVRLEGVVGVEEVVLSPAVVDLEFEDSLGVSLGGQWQLGAQWDVRAGWAFETGAVPSRRYSVFAPDANKHLLALGATHRLRADLDLDLALGYYHMPEQVVTDSAVRQINPSDPEQELALVVGNGRYQNRFLTLGLALNWRF